MSTPPAATSLSTPSPTTPAPAPEPTAPAAPAAPDPSPARRREGFTVSAGAIARLLSALGVTPADGHVCGIWFDPLRDVLVANVEHAKAPELFDGCALPIAYAVTADEIPARIVTAAQQIVPASAPEPAGTDPTAALAEAAERMVAAEEAYCVGIDTTLAGAVDAHGGNAKRVYSAAIALRSALAAWRASLASVGGGALGLADLRKLVDDFRSDWMSANNALDAAGVDDNDEFCCSIPVPKRIGMLAAERDALRAEIAALKAERERTSKRGCPCVTGYVAPCREHCTCANPIMSGGCERCASYGSEEQVRAAAERIVATLATGAERAEWRAWRHMQCARCKHERWKHAKVGACGWKRDEVNDCECEGFVEVASAPAPSAPLAGVAVARRGDPVTLDALPPGSLFETVERGIRAVKSEYRYSNGEPECTLLESGERAHFAAGGATKVRPLTLTLAEGPGEAGDESQKCMAALAAERTAHEATRTKRGCEEAERDRLRRERDEARARVAALEGDPRMGLRWGIKAPGISMPCAFASEHIAKEFAEDGQGFVGCEVIDLSAPAPARPESDADTPEAGPFQEVTYTNHRGETRVRSIQPRRVWYGTTKWHPEAQWFVDAFDEEKGEERSFALEDFGQPAPASDGALRRAAEEHLKALEAWTLSLAWAQSIEETAANDGYSHKTREVAKTGLALRAALSASAPSEGEGSGTEVRAAVSPTSPTLTELAERVAYLEKVLETIKEGK